VTLPDRVRVQPNHESIVRRQVAFGYTEEDLRILLTPMAATGAEPLGSMGTDTPTAVLSQRARLLYDYFVELFAQVTNPPLDAIREAVVTSMARVMGPEQNLLEPTAASCRQIKLSWPVLDNDELNKVVHINDDGEQPGLRTAVLRGLYDVERGGEGLADAIDELRHQACYAIANGARTLVISDRDSDHTCAPIPSLLAVSAVHHHLVRTKERTTGALVVESGDAREVHHIAMLIGFGAAAVNPYLAFESIEDLVREGEVTGIEPAVAVRNYLKALGKGVMKVMSKMGISTVASYTAAQAFEAIGLDRDVVDEYFAGTPSQLGGVGLDVLAEEVKQRHRRAYPENPTERVHRRLDVGGEYAFRREAELHLFTPEVVFLLQHSTRTGRHDVFARYSEEVDRLSREGGTLRGLFQLRTGRRFRSRRSSPSIRWSPASAPAQ
jgi:glutamate synthase (NADPH) large chain